jgi:hypothetical protein
MDDYVIPKQSKKRRKDRQDMKIMTFAEKFGRDRRSLQDDSRWLGKVGGIAVAFIPIRV